MSGNNVVYFTTTDASGFYATALWVTDGTAAGTRLVQSYPAGTTITPLGTLLTGFSFAASTPAGKTFFYATDGTPLSTRQIGTGTLGPLPANAVANDLAVLSPILEVLGFTRANGSAEVDAVNLLTAAPTKLLTALPQSALAPETVGDFTALGGVAFFVDGNTAGVSRLYRTDGTVANTVNLGSAQSISSLVVETNASDGTRLFFAEGTTATPATSHGELMAVSASGATPSLVFDFGAGTAISSITEAANILFVVTHNADATNSLWSSDGSNAAPVLVGNLGSTAPTQVLADDDGSGRVFMQVGDEVLIASAGGTTVLGTFTSIGSMFVNGGTLYFGANADTGDLQLWSSDGSKPGTTQIADINPTGSANPTNFAELNGTLFFSADDGVHGTELWKWNGSVASLVSDIAPGALGSNPALITPGLANPGAALGLVTFAASEPSGPSGFGVSDGTVGGTAVAFTAPPGVASISNSGLTVSHGSRDTTITLTSPFGGGGAISTTTLGAFFTDQQIAPVSFSESQVLQFTGYDATSVVVLGTFEPTITGGVTTITDRVASGGTEYFLVENGDGNDRGIVAQLWSSDGTVANTKEIANLGSVSDPGNNVFPGSSDATVGTTGWSALLADDTTKAVSLFTSTGAVGNFAEVTLASIGLSGTIDNTNYFSVAQAGSKYFFSVANGGSIEAVATDGTVGGTAVLTSETPAGSSQVFGDFTAAGSKVYFDDGVGGALFVSDGSAAGTHMLLSSGAFISPYAPVQENVDIAGVASTASVTQGGTTYFYFTALQGGKTGLYYSDGSAVHQVMASGLAQNAFITESGGNIWFAAESTGGFTTLFVTAPGAAMATQVVSSAFLHTAYAPPENVSGIQVGVTLAASDTFFLTTGTDDVAGGVGDTFVYASPGDLTVGDAIDGGGGINDLYLTGTGTFDLGVPATLGNITQVLVTGSNDLIQLRAGTTLTLKDGAGDRVIGAADSVSVIGSGSDTITLGSSTEGVFNAGLVIVDAASEGASISAQTVRVAGGGLVTLGTNVTFAQVVTLAVPTELTVNGTFSNTTIIGSSGADTITLATPPSFGELNVTVTGGGGADDFVITGGVADSAVFRDTAAHLNGVTISGFNFAPIASTFGSGFGDFIDVTDFAFSSAETAVYSAGTLTITNAAGTAHTSIDIPGAPAGGGFLLSGDGGSGTAASFIPQLFELTTGPDTVVGTNTNVIEATDATLSSGDDIDGGINDVHLNPIESTLRLLGAGIFDMSLPAELTGLTTIDGDSSGAGIGGSGAIAQTIVLRNGLDTSVMLGAGHDLVFGGVNHAVITSAPENLVGGGYSLFVGDAGEFVQLSGNGADVIHVTAASGLANVSDHLEGSFSLIGTEDVDGGGLVPIGGAGDIATLDLTAATDMIEVGTVPDLIVGSAGTDTIDVTNALAGSFGGAVKVMPKGGGDTVVAPINDSLVVLGTQKQLDNTTIEGVNFLPQHVNGFGLLTGTTIDLSDLAFSAGVITTSFSGGTLSVFNDTTLVDTMLLPEPGAGSFTPAKDGAGTGTALTFTATGSLAPINGTLAAGQTLFAGSPGDDVLTVPVGVLAAGQTLDGAGGENEISLTGTGSFDLGLPAVLRNFSVLQPGSNETISLRAGLPMEIAGGNGGNTIIGANAPDAIALDGPSDTVVLNNPGASFFDAGTGVTVMVSAASIGATIDGATFGHDTLDVSGGGAMSMGDNIRDISVVDLTEAGATFFANGIPGLALDLSGDAGAVGSARDIVVAGGGGDTITEGSTGRNIFGAGKGDDSFIIQPFFNTAELTVFPQGDTIYNFAVSGNDRIVVPEVSPEVHFSDGTLEIGDTSGTGHVSIAMVGNYLGTFEAKTNPQGNAAVVTFSGSATSEGPAPCFATGTRILTCDGEVAVEALRVGDMVVTRRGVCVPVVWLGHRSLDCLRHPRPQEVWPVRVQAHAFGAGMPMRDLVLSPDHAVFVDEVLVPVRYLLNGATVVQMPVAHVTYWHVELERHAVLLADGMPAESYLDTGNRGAFDNGGAAMDAHRDFSRAVF